MQKTLFTLKIENGSQRESSIEGIKTTHYREIYKFLDKAGKQGQTVSMEINKENLAAFYKKIRRLNLGRNFESLVRKHDILMVTFNNKLFFIPTRFLKKVNYGQINDTITKMAEPIIGKLKNDNNLANVNILTHKCGSYSQNILSQLCSPKTFCNDLTFWCTNQHSGLLPSSYGTSRRGSRQGKIIKKILEYIRDNVIEKDKKCCHIDGNSYGNALANYIYGEIKDLFQDGGKYMCKYAIKNPYINMPFSCMLKQRDCINSLLDNQNKENVELRLINECSDSDFIHPKHLINEYKRILKERGYDLVDTEDDKQNQRQ